jgi:large subunit ribosomal protein L34e
LEEYEMKGRKLVKVPSGTVLRKVKRRPHDNSCAICAAKLNIKTNRKIPSEVVGMPKSQRRPSRPYGGFLCPACTRKLLSLKAMIEAGEIKLEDVEMRFKKYL